MSLYELFAEVEGKEGTGRRLVSGYRVEPFGGDPWDEELLRVAEAVDGSGD